ncbi:MAG: alanine--glyoxylate aminotransferase family protein [Bacillota bacterium]
MVKGRKLLMIPGPVEFHPEVMSALSRPTTSHVAPDFIECFGEALEMVRDVFLAPSAQPFVLAGTGTLAMDAAAANLVEPGDRVLVVNSGTFSDRMGELIERYGGEVTHLRAPIGDVAGESELRAALEESEYQVVTMTHVDTSTGVCSDIEGLCRAAREAGCLTIVDGVCGTAGAECHTEAWGVDVYLTASQKAIGVPPGLALLTVSQRAMDVFSKRKSPVPNYYADFAKWLPIMDAYMERRGGYFGTPAVNLVYALNVSLRQILDEGMQERFERHRRLARAFRAGTAALGIRQVPVSEDQAAPTLTALYYPEGADSSLTGLIEEEGVIVAGGLHPEIRDQYFRVGHMGVCNNSDLLATLGAIERALARAGCDFEMGSGVRAAQRTLERE